MIAGAGRSIGSPLRLDRPLAVERPAERIDDAAEQRRPDRHAHDVAGAAHRDPASIASTSSSRTQPTESVSSTWAKPNWPVEAQQLVEPDVGQPGDQRDAVADLSTRPICSRPAGRDAIRATRLARARSSQGRSQCQAASVSWEPARI